MTTRKAAMVRRLTAVTATTGLVGLLSAAPGFADGPGSGVHVVNTETVQVYLNAKGDVQSKRVYEQIALTGHGKVDVANPVSTDGLRNLDGFGGFEVRGGDQIVKAPVDGTRHYRSVSNYDGDLPVSITPEYYLDGQRVNPGDIVGSSGSLRVQFTVQNRTTQKQQVSYPDGHGGTTTATVDVPVPMVGSLTTDLPSTFTHVAPGGANTAGDGKGGTTMSYTMTLFPPIGSTTARFGYTADITDGVVPDVDVSMLPVDPMASPTFRSAAESYQGGADTGAQLVDGAGQIDANLLKLRDGAATLLAGLIKLRNGADQLHTGLADTAAPGAKKLADGAGDLDNGLGRIDDGAQQLAGGSGQLADGARRLSAGAGDAYVGGKKLRNGAIRLRNGLGDANDGGQKLDVGASQLSDGQKALSAGLDTLYAGVDALPDTVQKQLAGNADYQRLTGALSSIITGIGNVNDASDETLLGGINMVLAGLRNPALDTSTCNQDPSGPTDPTACGVSQGLEIAQAKLEDGVASIDHSLLPAALGVYQGLTNPALGLNCPALNAGLPLAALTLETSKPLCYYAAVAALGYGAPANIPALAGTPFEVGGLAAQLDTARGKLSDMQAGVDHLMIPGLQRIKRGLSNPGCDPGVTDTKSTAYCGVAQAVSLIAAGVPTLVSALSSNIQEQLLAGIGSATPGCDTAASLRCGAAALVAGGDDLSAGVDQLATGLAQLDAGGVQLASGAGTLTSGLGQISSGAGDLSAGADKLHAGAGDLADGTAEAKDGSSQVAAGASQLSDGLGDAADGSGRIADGLQQAANGAPRLVDGAQRLSTEGMGQLVKAGESTAQNYGEMYAVMQAGAERAHSHSMAFGAPKGADGLTAYSFVMKGDDGESGRNWTRGIAALAVLGLGAGAFALRRRLA